MMHVSYVLGVVIAGASADELVAGRAVAFGLMRTLRTIAQLFCDFAVAIVRPT
jgi:hypothetical protein